MRKLIVVFTVVAAPLVTAAPAAAATADHPAAGSRDAAVVVMRFARDGLAHPPCSSRFAGPRGRHVAAVGRDEGGRRGRDAAPTPPRRRRDGVGMRRRARGALRPGVRGQRLGPGAAGGGLILR